jgi:hypothetical protein
MSVSDEISAAFPHLDTMELEDFVSTLLSKQELLNRVKISQISEHLDIKCGVGDFEQHAHAYCHGSSKAKHQVFFCKDHYSQHTANANSTCKEANHTLNIADTKLVFPTFRAKFPKSDRRQISEISAIFPGSCLCSRSMSFCPCSQPSCSTHFFVYFFIAGSQQTSSASELLARCLGNTIASTTTIVTSISGLTLLKPGEKNAATEGRTPAFTMNLSSKAAQG